MARSREEYVFKTRIAQRAGRYDDAMDFMRKVGMLDVDLTTHENALLTLSYKNSAKERRISLRLLDSIKEEDEQRLEIIANYREQVESELSAIHREITVLIDRHLIPHSTNEDSKALYYRMKGDYCRYLMEFKNGNAKEELMNKALEAYEDASGFANLPPANPTRLGVALNFSVFCYDIMNLPERGLKVAEDAVNGATDPEFDALDEQSKELSTFIMKTLKYNLTRWNPGKDRDNMEKRDCCLTVGITHCFENLNPRSGRKDSAEEMAAAKSSSVQEPAGDV